jgi:transposase
LQEKPSRRRRRTIEEELARLRAEARELRKRKAIEKNAQKAQEMKAEKLEKIAGEQKQKTKRQNGRIAELEKEIGELKSRLGIEIDKAKKFAGMIFKSNIRKRGEERPGAGRGAAVGHQGHGKKKPERIDREVGVFLAACADCGNPLHRTSSVDERIVLDIPQILPISTLYRIERQWCAHCHKEVHAIPQNTLPGCRFGTGVIIAILFFKYRMRAPLAKIEELLLSQYQISMTGQGIQELLHLVKTKFSKQYNDILEEFRNAPVKHADETSFRIDGMNGWCWLFATPSAAFYTIEETRGKEVPARIFGHDPTGVLVRDDCPSYFSLSLPQQSCWSHLLRVSHDAAVHENSSEEMKTLHKELKHMFDELEPITCEPFVETRRKKAYRKYAKRIAGIIARKYQNADSIAVQTRISNQKNNLTTVLLHDGAPLTNNHAERMIRPMVIARKISGGSRSDKGAATHAVNMSVMQTLALKGKDFFEGVSEIFRAGDKRYALGNGG